MGHRIRRASRIQTRVTVLVLACDFVISIITHWNISPQMLIQSQHQTVMSLPYSIVGRRGANLLDTIASSASAASEANGSYLGVVTRGFPNLFTMLGANTGLGHNSVVWMAECQANYAVDCVLRMRAARVRASEVPLSDGGNHCTNRWRIFEESFSLHPDALTTRQYFVVYHVSRHSQKRVISATF